MKKTKKVTPLSVWTHALNTKNIPQKVKKHEYHKQ